MAVSCLLSISVALVAWHGGATPRAMSCVSSHARMTSVETAQTSVEALAAAWKLVRREADALEGARYEMQPTDLANEAAVFKVTVVRSVESPSIGISLFEAGADGDLGLVIVDGIVAGSNAAALPAGSVQEGDVLVAAGLPGKPKTRTEGLAYDATVSVLAGLDPAAGAVELVLKRVRRRPMVGLTLQFPQSDGRPDARVELPAGANLRQAMLAHGIKLNDPLARRFDAGVGTGDCGGEGCCCTCAMEVLEGGQLLSAQGTQEAQILRRFPRWRLACKAVVERLEEDAEMTVRVTPRGWDGFYGTEERDANGKQLMRKGQNSDEQY